MCCNLKDLTQLSHTKNSTVIDKQYALIFPGLQTTSSSIYKSKVKKNIVALVNLFKITGG